MVSAGLSTELLGAMGTGAALPGGGSLMDKTLAGLRGRSRPDFCQLVVDTAIQGGDRSTYGRGLEQCYGDGGSGRGAE